MKSNKEIVNSVLLGILSDCDMFGIGADNARDTLNYIAGARDFALELLNEFERLEENGETG